MCRYIRIRLLDVTSKKSIIHKPCHEDNSKQVIKLIHVLYRHLMALRLCCLLSLDVVRATWLGWGADNNLARNIKDLRDLLSRGREYMSDAAQ